jgi:hypothetical protein
VAGAASRRVCAAAVGEREARLSETCGIILAITILLGFANDLWGASSLALAVIAAMRAACGQFAALQEK